MPFAKEKSPCPFKYEVSGLQCWFSKWFWFWMVLGRLANTKPCLDLNHGYTVQNLVWILLLLVLRLSGESMDTLKPLNGFEWIWMVWSWGILTHVTTRPMWQLDPRDNSTLVTTRPSWQLDPRDNVTTRPSWQLDPRDNSTLVTTRPSWQLDPRDNSIHETTRPSWQQNPHDNSTLVTTRHTRQVDCHDNSTVYVTTLPLWQLDFFFC